MMFTFKDIQARLELLPSVVVSGEYNYTYTFDNAIFNTYNYKGIELISFYVCCDSHIKVTYKYLNAIMTKVINLVQQETTKEWVFYLNSFSILNELFSTLPNYVDYIDVHTLYNGSEFVEKVYLEVVDTYHINRYVESGKSFVKDIHDFKDVFDEYADGFEDCRFRVQSYNDDYGLCVSIIFISSDDRYCDLVCDELEGTEEILLECYGGELSFEVYI